MAFRCLVALLLEEVDALVEPAHKLLVGLVPCLVVPRDLLHVRREVWFRMMYSMDAWPRAPFCACSHMRVYRDSQKSIASTCGHTCGMLAVQSGPC